MVITDSRDPRFESSNQQILFATNCIEKTKMRGKEAGNCPIKKIRANDQSSDWM